MGVSLQRTILVARCPSSLVSGESAACPEGQYDVCVCVWLAAERAEMTDAAAAVEWDDCTDEKSCRAKCESDAACWGFIYHPDNGWTTRGGEDQLGVRSFMSSPNIAAPAPPEEEGESSIPRVCPAGSGGFTECAPCTGNMYNDGTQLLCQPCASNQMAAADDGSSLLVKCVPRPPEKCEAGQGFPRGCSTDCKCEKCPINTFSTGVDTTCQACATGWEAKVEGSSSCVQQPPPPCNPGYGNWPQCDDTCVGRNKYNDGSFKQCQSCGAGERPNRDGTGCVAVIKGRWLVRLASVNCLDAAIAESVWIDRTAFSESAG